MDSWLEQFPQLAAINDPAWPEIVAASRVVRLPPATPVFRQGDACQNYMLVLEGSVRVQKTAENGREITLYRVESGESCVLTTSCLMAGEHYPAEGITETEVSAVVIPWDRFEFGLAACPGFRRFVFSNYGRRLGSLIVLVEEIAFRRIDARLAQNLYQRSGDKQQLECTHQTLAAELGTAREVVSRQLKDFERRGWIQLHRGRIHILDPIALHTLATE